MSLLNGIPLNDVLRCALIYLHLVLFGVAIALVFWADLRIFRVEMTNSDYHFVGRLTLRLFAGLWVSGHSIIFIDTGFNPEILATKSKLLIKLTCVLVLSANSVLLHKVYLNILVKQAPVTATQAFFLSICGTLSTSHWLLAAFVGSAKMLGQFSLFTPLTLYLGILCSILLLGVVLSPYMRQKLNQHREPYSGELHLVKT